jgi:hypothetical protein
MHNSWKLLLLALVWQVAVRLLAFIFQVKDCLESDVRSRPSSSVLETQLDENRLNSQMIVVLAARPQLFALEPLVDCCCVSCWIVTP